MRLVIISMLCFLFSVQIFAQEQSKDTAKSTVDSLASVWKFAAAAYYYILPGEKNTATIVGYADHKAIHFEARYNYEDKNTVSLFGGYKFETGNKLVFVATPMLGVVFGNTNGMAPGLLLDLTYKKFDFYSESEYVIDFAGKENNFLYTWTELAITPFKNFRTGVSANRTRLIETGFDIERGIFAQYSFWKLTAGVHYFNPFANGSFVISTLGIEF